MKKAHFHLLTFTLLSLFSWAQTKPVRIVFDVTNNDTLTHRDCAAEHANSEAKEHPDGKV